MQQPDSYKPESPDRGAFEPASPMAETSGVEKPDPIAVQPEPSDTSLFRPEPPVNPESRPELSDPAVPNIQLPVSAGIEKPVNKGVWSAWPTVGLSFVIFFANGLVQALVMLVFAISMTLEGFSFSDPLAIQKLLQDLLADGQMLSLAVIASSVAGVAVTLFFIMLRRGDSIVEYLGLKAISWKTILLMVGIYAAMLGLSIGLSQIVETSQGNDIFSDAYHNTPWPAVFWLALVVFGPFYEEFLFRGFLFAGLRQSALGVSGTIVVTGLAFALLHAAQYGAAVIAQIFLLGIVFGVVRWKTGSLWSSIFLHGLWNCGQLVMMTFWPTLGG